jgi:hypothetical protein
MGMVGVEVGGTGEAVGVKLGVIVGVALFVGVGGSGLGVTVAVAVDVGLLVGLGIGVADRFGVGRWGKSVGGGARNTVAEGIGESVGTAAKGSAGSLSQSIPIQDNKATRSMAATTSKQDCPFIRGNSAVT